MNYTFPKDFLWGTATAAHQVEGGNVYNDSWLMEHTPGMMFKESSGDAIDHYHRYPEDIALLSKLGFNMYRFSLEWSRIEPEEGEFSLAALEHYRRMLATCHENGILPMLTFHHFTSPRWLMRYGGWMGDKTPEIFARFCERAARHLGDLIGAACTLNEINVSAVLTSMGHLPELAKLWQMAGWKAAAQSVGVQAEQFVPFQFLSGEQGRKVVIEAHRRATAALKAGPGTYPVGVTLALTDVQAAPGGEEAAARINYAINDVYLEAMRGDDFVGVQTYTRMRVGAEGPLPAEAGVPVTQMGYEFYPEALEGTIRNAIKVAGAPVIVTENGLGSEDDTQREVYIRRALGGVARCLQDGLDVRGYTYWSAFDNFEWMLGYEPKFGLIGVDHTTQERKIKPSAQVLGQIARSGMAA